MVEINFTFVLFTISFLVFLVLMKLVFFSPIAKVIEKREGFIDENIASSKKIQEKIETQIRESDSSSILANARQDAQRVVNAALEDAKSKKAKTLKENSEKLKLMYQEHSTNLEQEKTAVYKNIDKLVEEVVTSAVSRILSEIESGNAAKV